MSQPTIQQGWLRALMFMPIWFITTFLMQAIGVALMMLLSALNGTLDIQDQAAIETWMAGLAVMDFASPRMLAFAILSILSSFFAIWFMMVVINKEPLKNIGLSDKDRENDMLAGLGTALLFIGGIFFILWLFGAITVTGTVAFKQEAMIVSLMLFVAAFDEEIVFRGYLLNNLMDSMNRWWALGISSLVFALMHAGNPNVWSTFVPMTELFAAGFILGISYTFTKNLWFPTFFHFGWNFFQGLFGFEISGMGVDSWKLIVHENSGQVPDIVSGGSFGIEGSIVSLLLTIMGTYFIYKYYKTGFSKTTIRNYYTISKRFVELVILGAILCLGLSSCSDNLSDGTVEDPNTGQPMIVGSIVLEDLKQEPFEEWYASGLQGYDVDLQLISAIDNPNGYTYEVFLGTWCADSRREVPKIAKIFQTLDIAPENVQYVCVDRDKISPGNEHVGKDIRYVPTVIVSKNNEEIGRIVETPIGTIESDLLEINLGIPPTPNYAQ